MNAEPQQNLQTKKKLHSGLFAEFKKLHQSGKTYSDIAQIYTNLGFVNHRQNKLVQADISHFMLRHGYRCHAVFNSPARNQSVTEGNQPTQMTFVPPAPIVKTEQGTMTQMIDIETSQMIQHMKDLREIKNSNLSDELKSRLIQLYI